MQIIIDRFEGEFAVVEYENKEKKLCFVNIPKVIIPGAAEGDVIDITINKDETKKREKNIKNLMDSLFE